VISVLQQSALVYQFLCYSFNMKTLMLALALLVPPPSGQQQTETAPKHDTAHDPRHGTSNGVPLVSPEKHGDSNAATGTHDPQTPERPPPSYCQRFGNWLATLHDAEWISFLTLVVTSLYLLATVMIWIAMLKSNKHAETAYNEGKDAANADRELLRQQLAEMKTTSTDTHDLAIAAKDAVKAVLLQADIMATQASALITASYAAKLSAETATRALELIERADILITEVTVVDEDLLPSNGMTVQVFIKNSGRSRADDVSAWCTLTIPAEEGPFTTSVGGAPVTLEAGGILNKQFPSLGEFILIQNKWPIIDSIAQGIMRLRFDCIVNYKDVFQREHKTVALAFYDHANGRFTVSHTEKT
jgi:hypothetical protein